jgi:DNA-directed RNA polymerase specialized sigma24 family protein
VDQLSLIRDPAALPGWIATTTRQECGRLVSAPRRREVLGYAQDAAETADPGPGAAYAEVLVAERNAVLREAVRQLPPRCRGLISLLIADPPVSYADTSGKLDIPVGSTGPTRGRCLERLRRHPAMAALISAGAFTAEVN